MAPTVHLPDRDETVEAEDGETLLDALLDAGIDWPHACGGFCNCTTCGVLIRDGADNLSTMQDDEQQTLKRFLGPDALDRPLRLSCQVTVEGDCTITDPELY